MLDGQGADERGVVAPSRVMLVAVVVLMIGAATYFATTPSSDQGATTVSQQTSPSAGASTPPKKATPKKATSKKATSKKAASKQPSPSTGSTSATPAQPAFKRADTVVEVFNNSNVPGLAGRTSQKAKSAGWNVVGQDNWYGTIPSTTVYYPKRLKAAAQALARDLGITRVMPAIAPMRFDRLTVILTADYTS